MIVLVSLIVVLLRGFPCFHDFSYGASLHPNDFYTCILLCLESLVMCIYSAHLDLHVHVYTCTCVGSTNNVLQQIA